MGINLWQKSTSYRETKTIRLGQHHKNDYFYFDSRRNNNKNEKKILSGWLVLWKKIKRSGRKTMFQVSVLDRRASRKVVAYEPYDYGLNFDQRSDLHEPEYLSRSFSARYADPSKSRRRRSLLD